MPLPTGSWELVANGVDGKLHIESVDNQGNVRGMLNDAKLFGFWNETMQRLSFMTVTDDVMEHQTYTGFHFVMRSDEPSMRSIHMLTGSYETFGGGETSAERSVFGWFARIQSLI